MVTICVVHYWLFWLSTGPTPLSTTYPIWFTSKFCDWASNFLFSYSLSSVLSSSLHYGQELCSFNQGSRHPSWNKCSQGISYIFFCFVYIRFNSSSEISPITQRQTQHSVFLSSRNWEISCVFKFSIAFLLAGGGPYLLGSFSMMC